ELHPVDPQRPAHADQQLCAQRHPDRRPQRRRRLIQQRRDTDPAREVPHQHHPLPTSAARIESPVTCTSALKIEVSTSGAKIAISTTISSSTDFARMPPMPFLPFAHEK